ncbi:MAG: hypothetical protein JW709_04340 [Sedimentisphaerales bacterium]|nr:hypothetical protein [Sedimentisphaerales bacterium]
MKPIKREKAIEALNCIQLCHRRNLRGNMVIGIICLVIVFIPLLSLYQNLHATPQGNFTSEDVLGVVVRIGMAFFFLFTGMYVIIITLVRKHYDILLDYLVQQYWQDDIDKNQTDQGERKAKHEAD